MSKSTKKRSVGLTPMREYPTFQGIYELHPQNDLTNDELYAKCILTVIEWLRGRIRKNGGDPSFLDKYPMPESYKSFDVSTLEDDIPTGGYYLMSINWQDESTWALVVDEPGKREYQWFKTMVTLKKLESSVALAAQTICRETIEGKHAEVYRLGFITHVLMSDEDILITEYGIDKKWPLYKALIELNGRSNSDIEDFKKNLVDNPHRNFPIIVQTVESEVRIHDDEAAEKTYYDSAKMVSYTVVLNGSTRKLFCEESDERCAEILENKKGIVVIGRAADNAAPKPYNVYDEDGEFKYSDYNGMCFEVKHNTRKKKVDFEEIGLYTDIREKRLLSNLVDGGLDHRAELSLVIQTLQDELAEKTIDLESNTARIEELESENEVLKNKNLNLSRENRKMEALELELGDKHADSKSAEETIVGLEEKITELIAENAKNLERLRPLLDIQLPGSYPREKFIKWIRDNYSEAIIVHERAEKEFLADSKPRDFNMIARMIHYLYGYTICTNDNPGDYNCAVESSKNYDVLGENWEATNSGDAYIHNKEAYTIDISKYDSEEGDVILNKHITNGKGMDSDSVRIYFYYDSRIGKTIIGSMPNHLPMAGLSR